MKKHIEDLCNALYKRDLTVAAEEDTPAFPAVCQLRLLLNGKARNIAVFHQNQPPFVAA